MTRVAFAWIIGLMVVINFVAFRVAVPELINMHNDGGIIAALLFGAVVLSADYILYRKFSALLR